MALAGIDMKRLLIGVALLASGCAKLPDDIQASAVAADPYMAMSCEQLVAENARSSAELATASEAQTRAAQQDQAAMAVLHVPVASMRGKDQEETIARLKGENAAIVQARQAKGC